MKKYYYAILLLLSIFNCYSQDNTVYTSARISPQPNEDISLVGKKIAQNIPCLKTGIDYDFYFIVEIDGSLSSVELLEGELDLSIENCKESIQIAFANSPKWIPGYNGNIPVRVRYRISLKKEIEDEIKSSNDDSLSNNISNEKISEWDFYYRNGVTENPIIDTTKIGSYIKFYAIGNKGNGKWLTCRKGRWSNFFNDRVLISGDNSVNISWEEWYVKYGKSKKHVLDGIAYEYIGNLKNNKPDGDWIITYGSLKAKGSFVDGKPNGEWLYYKKNSSKKSINNLENIILKENYINGKPNGDWFSYNEEFEDKPVLKLKESFKDGNPNGEIIRYEKGAVYTKTNFLNGLPNGESYMYGGDDSGKPTGKIAIKFTHKLGKPISCVYGDNYEFKIDFLENTNLVRKSKLTNGKFIKLMEIDRNLFDFQFLGDPIDIYTAGVWRVYMILSRGR